MSYQQISAFISYTPMLSFVFIALTAALIYTELARRLSGVRFIGVARVTELINREDALVVDISPINDFEAGHIVGAISIPVSQLDPENNKQLLKAKEKPIVLVCRAGMNAGDAAKKLKKSGYGNVHVLEGGVGAWRAADLPLARGRS